MCVQEPVSRRTRVRAIAGVCARPLWAGHHPLQQLPSGRVQRRVYPTCGSPATLPSRWRARGVHRGRAGKLALSTGSQGVSGSRPSGLSSPTGIFCFREPPLRPRGALRGGVRQQPRPGWRARVARLLARAAPPLPPPPRRPDGFFHDCIRPRAVFVPAVPGRACNLARLSPARRGFSRAQQEPGGAPSPPLAPAFSAGPRDPLRRAELSPFAPLRPSCPRRGGLRPREPYICAQSRPSPSPSASALPEALLAPRLLPGTARCGAGVRRVQSLQSPAASASCLCSGLTFLPTGKRRSRGWRPVVPTAEGHPGARTPPGTT
nr:uncharacterized protein LOC116153128 [Camelus dromedarius]XP_031308251.1 uncharacterized protein LOC116153128 [Camelus dromedarius]